MGNINSSSCSSISVRIDHSLGVGVTQHTCTGCGIAVKVYDDDPYPEAPSCGSVTCNVEQRTAMMEVAQQQWEEEEELYGELMRAQR